jgi:hypothetical protein
METQRTQRAQRREEGEEFLPQRTQRARREEEKAFEFSDLESQPPSSAPSAISAIKLFSFL